MNRIKWKEGFAIDTNFNALIIMPFFFIREIYCNSPRTSTE